MDGNAETQRKIDTEIKNLKNRLRDMEIVKIYGQKLTHSAKKHPDNNYITSKD